MLEHEQEQRAEDPIATSHRRSIDIDLVDAVVGGCDCCNGKADLDTDTDTDADVDADNYSNCCLIGLMLPAEAASFFVRVRVRCGCK